MQLKESISIEKIKKDQVKKISDSFRKIVNDDREYYKDKEYAKFFWK